jgi:hypothetical protein
LAADHPADNIVAIICVQMMAMKELSFYSAVG